MEQLACGAAQWQSSLRLGFGIHASPHAQAGWAGPEPPIMEEPTDGASGTDPPPGLSVLLPAQMTNRGYQAAASRDIIIRLAGYLMAGLVLGLLAGTERFGGKADSRLFLDSF
jgi:hypothetical protein